MATIGERLRAAREAKGFTMDDARRHTKIHTRILEAMEEDRTAETLDLAYAKVFLRKYAGFLQMDPGPLVEEYLRLLPAGRAETSPGGAPTGTPVEETAPIPRWVTPTAVSLVAIVGVAFLGFLARDLYRTMSSSSGPAPAARPAAPAATPPAPAPRLLVPKSQPLRVGVRASQDCWMQVKADGKVLFQNVLGKGREETWTAADELELWVGNAAALTLTVNGQPQGPIGRGVVRGVRVTRYGVQLPRNSSP